jgi:hypothetical protein
MQSVRQTAARAARTARTNLPRQQRRYAHDSHHHGPQEPVNEHFGMGFYLPLSMIPAGYALYKASEPDEHGNKPTLTRWMAKYIDMQDEWQRINDLHVRLVEEAGRDRQLFLHAQGSETVELQFPDQFNVGSPYNVSAGSQVDLTKVIQKYQREANEENERKLQQLRDGTLPIEQPFESTYERAMRHH